MEDVCAAVPPFPVVPTRMVTSSQRLDGIGVEFDAAKLRLGVPARMVTSSQQLDGNGVDFDAVVCRAPLAGVPVRRVSWTRQLRGEVIFFSDSWPRWNT
jgi:hypothetical protein